MEQPRNYLLHHAVRADGSALNRRVTDKFRPRFDRLGGERYRDAPFELQTNGLRSPADLFFGSDNSLVDLFNRTRRQPDQVKSSDSVFDGSFRGDEPEQPGIATDDCGGHDFSAYRSRIQPL